MELQTISFQATVELVERPHDLAASEGRDQEDVLLEAVDGYLRMQERRDALTLEATEDMEESGWVPQDEVAACAKTLGSAAPLPMPKPRKTADDLR